MIEPQKHKAQHNRVHVYEDEIYCICSAYTDVAHC